MMKGQVKTQERAGQGQRRCVGHAMRMEASLRRLARSAPAMPMVSSAVRCSSASLSHTVSPSRGMGLSFACTCAMGPAECGCQYRMHLEAGCSCAAVPLTELC